MKVKRPELVLAGATAVSIPMVPGLLAGEISATTAATRFLVALIVCWVIGSVLSWVIHTYSAQARRNQIMRLVEGLDQHDDEDPSGPAAG